jgi:hypothetical protein
LTDGKPGGAMQKALYLFLYTKPEKDLLDPRLFLEYPDGAPAELHHIFPSNWCKNNKYGELRAVLDKEEAGRDYVNCVANLMLLSRESNNKWRARIPGQALQESDISYDSMRDVWNDLFINQLLYNYLREGGASVKEFLDGRAKLLSEKLVDLSRVKM